jgi:hypothetical protein
MNVSPIASTPVAIDLKAVAGLYQKNSPISLSTNAADWFGDTDTAELVHDLKKSLMLAIDCGNFDKAMHILKMLKELKG